MNILRTSLVCSLLAASSSVALAADIAPGDPGPAFSLASQAGPKIDLSSLKGQVVLINFWASWCGPCRQEMPVLEQINKRYKALGVTLLGVNVEPDSSNAAGWLKATPVSFPILFDTDSKVSKLYDVAGMPNTVILDRKGTVRFVHRGYKPGEENEYMDQIRTLARE
jgi:peroxiredoxin